MYRDMLTGVVHFVQNADFEMKLMEQSGYLDLSVPVGECDVDQYTL